MNRPGDPLPACIISWLPEGPIDGTPGDASEPAPGLYVTDSEDPGGEVSGASGDCAHGKSWNMIVQ